VTDRAAQRALLEAIKADVRSRVDQIIERFVREIYETMPREGVDAALHAALADVSGVLAEGIVAQIRESGRMHPGRGQL